MHHKKRAANPNKNRFVGRQNIAKIAFILIVIIILGIFIFKKPTVTGRVVQGEEAVFSENLNLQVNESGTYEWKVKNPGDIKSLKATGSVSSNGTARVYIEKNGEKQLLFDSTKQVFDVDIHVLPEYKKIFQGDEVLIQIVLFNLRGFGSGNVSVKYSIKDSRGNLIASEEEVIFVETRAEFVRKLEIPPELKPGTYIAFVEVFTNVVIGSGSDSFEVKSKYQFKYPQELKYYIIGFIAVIVFVIIFISVMYRLGILKKKQKIAEIKEKIPLEKIEKLEKELKALEEAYKSNFISEESYKRDKERIEKKLQKSRR